MAQDLEKAIILRTLGVQVGFWVRIPTESLKPKPENPRSTLGAAALGPEWLFRSCKRLQLGAQASVSKTSPESPIPLY